MQARDPGMPHESEVAQLSLPSTADADAAAPAEKLTQAPPPVAEDRRRGIASLRRHSARGMIVNSVFDIALVGTSALRGLVVAVFLTRSDYGLWGIIGLALWTALGFKSVFGANDKYIQQSDENQEDAFQRAFTVELIFAGVLIPFAGAVVVLLVWLSGRSAALAPGLALLLLIPATALQFPIATFYRRMDYRRQRSLQAIDPVVGTTVMITVAALGGGYWCFVAGSLAGAWASAVVALKASPYGLGLRYHRGTLHTYL